MNYETDIRIDETCLDVEWLEQASLAMKYVQHYAECRKRLTLAEEKIKVIKAELIKKVNEDPVRFCNKEKPNIADIESYYRNHSRHKAAKEEWVEAQFELDIAEGAKNEISFTRKMALENLVILHGQQYFAGPKVPRNLSDERKRKQEEQKRSNAGISSRILRRNQ